MNTKHTPEPWRVDKQSPQEKWPGIEAADNTSIVIFGTDDDDGGVRAETEEQALANADRMVACVNALAGLNPEAIKDVVGYIENRLEGLSDNPHPSEGGSLTDHEEAKELRRILTKLKEGQQ